MSSFGAQPADDLVLIALQIRDEERRKMAIHHLENLPTERPCRGLYEMNIGDWDEGLWDEEVAWLQDLLEGTQDRIVIWRFAGNSYTRFTIGEGG